MEPKYGSITYWLKFAALYLRIAQNIRAQQNSEKYSPVFAHDSRGRITRAVNQLVRGHTMTAVTYALRALVLMRTGNLA